MHFLLLLCVRCVWAFRGSWGTRFGAREVRVGAMAWVYLRILITIAACLRLLRPPILHQAEGINSEFGFLQFFE